MPRLHFHSNQGFTLIEVLVSTIILAIGLLGVASMQTLALKDNQDAFFSTQASSLAYEMSDRIAANIPKDPNTGVKGGPWMSTTIPTPTTTCTSTDTCNTTTGCDPDAMAKYDFCVWKKNVENRIGSTAVADIKLSPYGTGACAGGNASRRCIVITWDRNKKLGTQAQSSYELEMTP